jgi:mitogen-activated protein kinase kinase kinase 1
LKSLYQLYLCSEGAFFAVKEVSLLDQGSNAQQSILALEQVISAD